MDNFNVVIIGAGPSGSTCALRLKQLGCAHVLLVDAGKKDAFRIGESTTPDTNLLLKKLDLFPSFLKEGHEPCFGSVSYWGTDQKGYNDFLISPHGHGWHLDREKFDEFLINQAQKKGVVVWKNTKYLKSKKLDNEETQLEFVSINTELTVKTDFVIDATGGRAAFAQDHGAKKVQNLSLISLSMRFKQDLTRNFAKQTLLASSEIGWWYGAPIPNNQILVSLFTNKELVKNHRLNHQDVFMPAALGNPHIGPFCEGLEPLDNTVKGVEAPSFYLDKVHGRRWLAIGDSAASYDPIMSYGITKAMMDGNWAAELIAEKGDLTIFGDYVKGRYKEYLTMRTRFYQSEKRWADSPFWRWIRAEECVA
ncbi:MAG: flavin-dependent dehydrogenase [Sphingobacteriales bacterium]